jgi:hypothetical protein
MQHRWESGLGNAVPVLLGEPERRRPFRKPRYMTPYFEMALKEMRLSMWTGLN